ncbi:MAG: aminotransferase class IV [Vicinamibacterales bacterium]
MSAVVNINGRLCQESDAVISVFDHGFLFGDGVYEVLRTYGGRPFLFAEHQRRLRESADRLVLPVPFSDEEIQARMMETIAAHREPGEKYIRVLLTRGVGEFSYDPRVCPTPTLVMIVKPHVGPPSKAYDDGVSIAIVNVVRNHPASLNPRIKSNNLLNNALAMQAAIRAGSDEALMRNHRGALVECSQSNFFVVRDQRVLTPPLASGLLGGITRAFVIDLGRALGFVVEEADVFESDVATASEAFLTSTTREITPVTRIDGAPVGSARPGPVTVALLNAFRQRARALTQAAPAHMA